VVVQLALRVLRTTCCVAQPEIALPLSENATVPPSGAGLTVAVNVTDWPTCAGLLVEVSTVLVDVCVLEPAMARAGSALGMVAIAAMVPPTKS
jgi:hypothetical protein